MAHTLIICIGNVARGDDGVAHRVAALLAETGDAVPLPTGTRLLTAVGLDVAMSADVGECDLLLVVDAERRATPAVEVTELAAGTAAHSGHGIDAPGLLAVTQALYGSAPRALLVSVAAPEMGHEEALSPVAHSAALEAARTVVELCSAGS